MTNLQSSVDPAFSMFLEERRKEEKARADRARILRATNKNRGKRTTGVGRIDRAKTDAINARRSEMNVNQTSGTAAQNIAKADRRAPEHHVVTDASGNQTSVLGPRPESVQTPNSDQAFPTEASMTPRNVSRSLPIATSEEADRIKKNLRDQRDLRDDDVYDRGVSDAYEAAHSAGGIGLHEGHNWNTNPEYPGLFQNSNSPRNGEIRSLREDFLFGNRHLDLDESEAFARDTSMLRRIQAAEEDENRREEDEINEIVRMMEGDPGGVSNPNRNMMFESDVDQDLNGIDLLIQGTKGIGTSINDWMKESVAASRAEEKARFNALSEEEQDAEIAANKARAVAVGQTFDFLDPVTDAVGEVNSSIGGFFNDAADDYEAGKTRGIGSLALSVLRSLAETVMPDRESPPPSIFDSIPDPESLQRRQQLEQSQIAHGERMREIKSAREDRALNDQYHRDRQFSVGQTLRNNPRGMAVPEAGFPQSFEEYKAREQQELDEFKNRQQEASIEALARMGGF